MTGNVWFISGATSGFGKEIAIEALARGDKVVATSRNTSKISSLAAQGALLIDLDVTAPDATIQAALDAAVARFGTITHFINAAGYILEGPIEGISRQESLATFDVNVLGLVNMVRLQAAFLRPRRAGVIANFGSMASWRGFAGFSLYTATKWAVSGFTESVYEEMRPFGVSAVAIEPGYFRTGFLNTGGGNRIIAANQLEDEYRGTAVEDARIANAKYNDKQPGDVVKGAKLIVDVLTQSGVAAGRDIPKRLILGNDCVSVVRSVLADTEAGIKEWEELITSTDHDDVKA